MIKTLIYDVKALKRVEHKDVEWTGWVVALVRGNHEINEQKLEHAVRASLKDELLLEFGLATPDSIEELTGAAVGFAGPQGLAERADLMVVDRDVATMRNAATGANKTDYHVKNVNPGVDFPIEGEKVALAKFATSSRAIFHRPATDSRWYCGERSRSGTFSCSAASIVPRWEPPFCPRKASRVL